MSLDLVQILRDTTVALVRRDSRDLTARQQAVYLAVLLDSGDHTVRSLAEQLNVSKPAITRAVDRLEALNLVYRVDNPNDHRSIFVKKTPAGTAYLKDVRRIMAAAAA
jgi:DNA-binding MarR family transcriptional regulator